MNYTKVSIFDENQRLEILSALLADKGIASLEIVQASTYDEFLDRKNEYDWDYVDPHVDALKKVPSHLIFYLEDDVLGMELLDEILYELMIFTPKRVEISSVSSEDWKNKWKEYFKPFHITKNIVVRPSWEDYGAKPGEIVIDLDPGMAFGTGDHPTSRLCILLLEEYMTEHSEEFSNAAVLDIGAGSGILSLAAALLGAKKVLGVEIDPEAIPVARENIRKNQLEGKISLMEGDLNKGIDFKADIILANLMADLIIRLAPSIRKNMKENGIFISSGILLEKKTQVVKSLEDAGFTIDKIKDEEEWCAIAAR